MKEPREKVCFPPPRIAGPGKGLEPTELFFDTLWPPRKEKAITPQLCMTWLSSKVPCSVHMELWRSLPQFSPGKKIDIFHSGFGANLHWIIWKHLSSLSSPHMELRSVALPIICILCVCVPIYMCNKRVRTSMLYQINIFLAQYCFFKRSKCFGKRIWKPGQA